MPITFDLQGGELKIPVVGQYDINLPLFFATKSKKGWKLLDPITTVRNLAKRKGKLAVDLKRKAVEEPEIAIDQDIEVPKIGDFSKADQVKLRKFEAELGNDREYGPHSQVKPRGTPVFLPKNGAKHGFKHQSNIGYKYGDNPSKKNPVVHPKRGRPRKDEDEDEEKEEKEKRPRGRPSMTAEQKAKTAAERKEKKDSVKRQQQKEQEDARNKEQEQRQNKRREEDQEWRSRKLMGREDPIEKRNQKKEEEEFEKGRREAQQRRREEEEKAIKAAGGREAYEREILKIIDNAQHGAERIRLAKARKQYKATLKHNRQTGRGLHGGSAISGVLDKVKDLVLSGVDTVKDIGTKVIYGRNDYPPHVKRILDKFGNKKVIELSLHRLVLPSIFTSILSVWTKGETAKRIAEEPKDKLFHISMWVKLEGGTTILCEKNEVISMTVSPRKGENEEVQVAKTPENTTLNQLLANGQAEMGDKFFTYSAKDNNCGNWIEGILRGNKLNDEATHAFIGQDAQKILEGFPKLRKFMNTLTDVAGRANVLLEGGMINNVTPPDSPNTTPPAIDQHITQQALQPFVNLVQHQATPQNRQTFLHLAQGISRDQIFHQLEQHFGMLASNAPQRRAYNRFIGGYRQHFIVGHGLREDLEDLKSHYNNIMPSHRVMGGAVLRMPFGQAINIGHGVPHIFGKDPRTYSSQALHTSHPGAMDTIFHAPNMVHYNHMIGMGIFDDIGKAFSPVARAFDPNQNGVARAFDPVAKALDPKKTARVIKRGARKVRETFKSGGEAERFGLNRLQNLRDNYRPLIKAGVGAAITGATGVPLSGTLAGKMGLDDQIDKGLDKANLGFGLRGGGRFVKGSQEAKDYMASIRKKKTSGGMVFCKPGVMRGRGIPGPHSRSYTTNPALDM